MPVQETARVGRIGTLLEFGHWPNRLSVLVSFAGDPAPALPVAAMGDTPNIRVGTYGQPGDVLVQRNGLNIQDSFGPQDGRIVR